MKSNQLIWSVYGLTILLGAFLMFLIQPVAGKIITPQYGGVSQVWCLCLLFFQMALLGGYTITWVLSHFKPKVQGVIYIALIVISIFFVHPPLGGAWAPQDSNAPVLSLLGALFAYLAIPCILLSTVSTIMQNWFSLARLGNPYSLYSVSNIGSMGALLVYPTLIEPHIPVSATIQAWTIGYWSLVGVACLSTGIMLRMVQTQAENNSESVLQDNRQPEAISASRFAAWIGLSTAGSILLMTFTTHITHDIAPIPLIWIIPLCAYLLTFILCFSGKNFYRRSIYIYLAQLVIFACFFSRALFNVPVQGDIAMHVFAMFLFCMICHGEVYALRPQPRQLPVFYLMIAIGGVLGGIAVNLISPIIFTNFYEFNLIIIGMLLLGLQLIEKFQLRLFYHPLMDKIYAGLIAISVVWFGYESFRSNPAVVLSERNFYGAVNLRLTPTRDLLIMNNGTTVHGGQLIDPKTKRMIYIPTTYYVENSGFGISDTLLRQHRAGKPLSVAAIGLGTGTVATYGRPSDQFTFFEIDPKIKKIAEDDFRFLKDSKAKINIVLGDARLSLQNNRAPKYDLILVDAFSGDSIPVHLLTQEAIQVYLSHLQPDGILLFHVSNRYLALPLPLTNLARHLGLQSTMIRSVPLTGAGLKSDYVAFSRPGWFTQALHQPDFSKQFPQVQLRSLAYRPNVGVWSDDYSNLLSIFMLDGSKLK